MDVLEPIVGSMTIGRDYLRPGDRSTVFVESYRDYFYLNGFNKLLGYNIDFIPLNGITCSTSEGTIADKLRSIEHMPVLLADTGIHDDDSLEELRKDKVQIYTVSEIIDGKASITDLFSDEDRAKLSPSDASFDRAACLSYTISNEGSVSDETKENFRKILDYISLG